MAFNGPPGGPSIYPTVNDSGCRTSEHIYTLEWIRANGGVWTGEWPVGVTQQTASTIVNVLYEWYPDKGGDRFPPFLPELVASYIMAD